MSKSKSKGMGIWLAVAAGIAIAGAHGSPGKHGSPTAAGMALGSGIPASPSSSVALGERMAAQRGWTGPQWYCLDSLWTRESGWQMVWNRQGSGAYGIPQALPASKMASAGPDYMTSARTQIRWGLGYIRATYGDPCNAWSHEESDNWY